MGTGRGMEFIPETLDALGELDAVVDHGTLSEGLKRAADLAQRIAPDLAGVSVAARRHGLTFTLVASNEDVAGLDGVQYLTDGPCVAALDQEKGIATSSEDLFSEPAWRSLAVASAALGIRSTLTFPIVDEGEVTGTVNLYGGSEDTFEGKHQMLATVFRAWAPGAVTNADLAFSTRGLAEAAPAKLRDDALVDAATGILAASYELTVESAHARLHDAAAQADVPVTELARIVVDLLNRPDET
ncbi:GAF and ANTAR domain-containing protein [Alloalcanivorax gelatiniphagus]